MSATLLASIRDSVYIIIIVIVCCSSTPTNIVCVHVALCMLYGLRTLYANYGTIHKLFRCAGTVLRVPRTCKDTIVTGVKSRNTVHVCGGA